MAGTDKPDKADQQEWKLRWEYHRLKVRNTANLPIPSLNDLGENGWELISVFGHHADLVFLFKRMKGLK